MATYVVTGATGFLGGQLVERLLEDPAARVHALVRESSLGRLEARARRWPGGERVLPLVGDLLQGGLGTFGEVMYAIAPELVDQLLHVAYRVFPDSAAARGQSDRESAEGGGSTLSRTADALVRLLPGVHW